MNYKDVREIARGFNKIIVTGAQRSGTTYAASVLAQDIGYQHVDECVYGSGNTPKFLEELEKDKVVIQAPGQYHAAMKIEDKNVLVVVMRRNVEDILSSEERIGWRNLCGVDYNAVELDKNKDLALKCGLSSEDFSNSCELKYAILEKTNNDNTIELDYDSLRVTYGWVEKEDRSCFSPKQTIAH